MASRQDKHFLAGLAALLSAGFTIEGYASVLVTHHHHMQMLGSFPLLLHHSSTWRGIGMGPERPSLVGYDNLPFPPRRRHWGSPIVTWGNEVIPAPRFTLYEPIRQRSVLLLDFDPARPGEFVEVSPAEFLRRKF